MCIPRNHGPNRPIRASPDRGRSRADRAVGSGFESQGVHTETAPRLDFRAGGGPHSTLAHGWRGASDERRQALPLCDHGRVLQPNRRVLDLGSVTAKLSVDALCNAVTRRGTVAGCILHADWGGQSQSRSRAMACELRRHDMVGSMGRVGAAGDNVAMESFWSLLQANVFNQRRRTTRQEPRAVVVWAERKYHRHRARDTGGGWLTPIEFVGTLAGRLASFGASATRYVTAPVNRRRRRLTLPQSPRIPHHCTEDPPRRR